MWQAALAMMDKNKKESQAIAGNRQQPMDFSSFVSDQGGGQPLQQQQGNYGQVGQQDGVGFSFGGGQGPHNTSGAPKKAIGDLFKSFIEGGK